MRKAKLNEAQQRWVREWWQALQPRVEGDAALPGILWAMGRGERARLRRCSDAEELLAQAATLLLAQRLIVLDGGKGGLPDMPRSYEQVAWVAGVLAMVKEDTRDGKSLVFALGNAAGNERPKMSDVRFKSLQRSTRMPDLFLQWRRAVQLNGAAVDVVRLADDLLRWQAELGQTGTRASEGVKFQWACDYYLSARERAATEEPASNKEISA